VGENVFSRQVPVSGLQQGPAVYDGGSPPQPNESRELRRGLGLLDVIRQEGRNIDKPVLRSSVPGCGAVASDHWTPPIALVNMLHCFGEYPGDGDLSLTGE